MSLVEAGLVVVTALNTAAAMMVGRGRYKGSVGPCAARLMLFLAHICGVRSHASWVRVLTVVSWQRSREWSRCFFWTMMMLSRRVVMHVAIASSQALMAAVTCASSLSLRD